MRMIHVETIQECIESRGLHADHWLWCMICTRFFPLRSVSTDRGGTPCCPYADCYGYGFDFHLMYWDTEREPEDPRWPCSTEELEWGMRSPEMESFYRTQLEARIERIVTAFRAATGAEARYLPAFFTMMSDLSWDLTDPLDEASFSDESARYLIDQLPVWSRTADLAEAPVMLDELRRFYAFAESTDLVRDTAEWRQFFANDSLVELLEHTMRTDRRLRPRRAQLHPGTRTIAPARARAKPSRHERR
ncbi:MAG TPA: hypothetical protein VML75_08705 [Kofleriaceae bacterium]|nr:hypothetical protein [Kofleriaceae bacterium]